MRPPPAISRNPALRALALFVSGAVGLGLGRAVLHLDRPEPAEPRMRVVIGPIRVRPASPLLPDEAERSPTPPRTTAQAGS